MYKENKSIIPVVNENYPFKQFVVNITSLIIIFETPIVHFP